VSGRLRIVLAAQLAFFGVWGAALLRSHAGAPSVWLATEPVDPRDLLSGHYVALRYPISSTAGCGAPAGTTVWVRLAETGETATTADGPVSLVHTAGCVTERPVTAPGERWIKGAVEPERGRDRITYGIERFYVAESSPLRDARSGQVVARIALADDGTARIEALVPLARAGTQPP
jgi:uncharacterized membrane-anchored protein